MDIVNKWIEANGKEKGKQIAEDPDLIQVVFDDVIRLANEKALNSLEKPKQIYLICDPWTDTMGILTPTAKLKRNVAK